MSSDFSITLERAVEIAQRAEPLLAEIGCHIALTGGCLFKGGSHKDIDYIIYPHDPKKPPEESQIISVLSALGLTDRFVTDERYVNRIVWIYACEGVRLDFFLS